MRRHPERGPVVVRATRVRNTAAVQDKLEEGESIYDPACGTGGMLLGAIEHVMRKGGDARTFYGKIYGQEKNLTCPASAFMRQTGVNEKWGISCSS
jgi:type I restriction enzyme M protein